METPRILTKSTSNLTGLSPSRPSTAFRSPKPPSVYDYKIEKLLGKGSYGEVHLARSPAGKAVALKRISKANKTYNRDDTEKEVEAGKKLNHKNVVKVLDSFEDEEYTYIVMEYIDGTDICTLYEMRNLQPLSETEVKKIYRQIIEAVAYIHLKVYLIRLCCFLIKL
jgi:serine/threonine protein kinase